MTKFSFHPFKSDKTYYKRTYRECLHQCAVFWRGDKYSLGVFDFLLLIPIVTKWADCHYDFEVNSLRAINVFFAVIKFLVYIPTFLFCLPFVFIYNEIWLCIGKSKRDTLENLEVLSLKPVWEFRLCHLETPPQAITFEVLNPLILEGDNVLVLFGDDNLYYVDRKAAQIKQIQPSAGPAQDFNDVCTLVKEKKGFWLSPLEPYNAPENGKLLLKTQRLIGYPLMDDLSEGKTIIHVKPFFQTYYENDTHRLTLKDFVKKRNIRDYKLIPVLLCLNALDENGQDTYRLILGIYSNNPFQGSVAFIVPNEENADVINELLQFCSFYLPLKIYRSYGISRSDLLSLALKQKDIFKEAMREIQRGLRVYTPLFLLDALSEESRSQSGAMFKIYNEIIVDYAENRPTPAESLKISALLGNTLWATPPRPLPDDLLTLANISELSQSAKGFF